MPRPAILVISPDRHFSDVVAEQVKRELLLSCQVVSDQAAAAPLTAEAALAVASKSLEGDVGCPVIVPRGKPLRLRELLADIEAALQKRSVAEIVELGGGFSLHIKHKQLVRNGQAVDLTDKEAQLLQCLSEAGGGSVGKEELLRRVWGIESALDTHTLETHIYRLRGKLRELAEGDEAIAAMEGGYGLRLS